MVDDLMPEMNQLGLEHDAKEKLRKMCGAMIKHGYFIGLDQFAIWKDGVQKIGCMEYNLRDIVQKVNETNAPF